MPKTRFSLIIPTRNRPTMLRSTLRCLAKVKYPSAYFEVLIIDNSDDILAAKKIVDSFQKKIPHLKYFTSAMGASVARNFGASKAKYQHLLFIDDDIHVHPDFLAGYNDAWQKYPQAKIIGGEITIQLPPTQSLTDTEQILLKNHSWCFSQTEAHLEDKILVESEMIFSANMSYRKERAEHAIFDEDLGKPFIDNFLLGAEDYELCTRKILEKEQLVHLVDPRVKGKHCVQQNRFTTRYLEQRYFFAGIEIAIMEKKLQQKFPDSSLFFTADIHSWKGRLISLFDHYKRTTLFSYLFNGFFLR
jgi:glycosyltransferase involved in cell wall biosynthesis